MFIHTRSIINVNIILYNIPLLINIKRKSEKKETMIISIILKLVLYLM